MAVRRNLIVVIFAALLLLSGIIELCLFYLSHEQSEREMYVHSKVSHYISRPADACIYLVNDMRNVEWSDVPQLSDTLLPPTAVLNGRTPEFSKPLFVVRYSSTDVALWCAITADDVSAVVRDITSLLCDGYRPVEEELECGRMYHFATKDNRFLHLYTAPGVMGCSYCERLLLPHDVDTTLAVFIDDVQRLSHCGVVYYADGYHYNDIHLTENGCEMHWMKGDCIEGLGDAVILDTTLISRCAMMAVQLQLSHHDALSSVYTLAYMPSAVDSVMPDVVLSVPIVQPDVVSSQLLSVYTPNGYRADSVALRRWFVPELLTAERYWLVACDGVLFASPSHTAMWNYIADLRRGDYYPSGVGAMSAASLFVVGDSIDVSLLPVTLSTLMPPYVTPSACRYITATPGKRGYKYTLRMK